MDRDEILRLLMNERRMLQIFIRSMLSDAHLAEDVLQDVFVVALRQSDQFTPGTNFGAWAREIARRTAYAHLRKAGRAPSSLDPETLNALEASLEIPNDSWDEEVCALNICVERLPAESRKILNMRYVANTALSEIGGAVGRSTEGVKALLKRIRSMLADCVNAELRRGNVRGEQ